MHEMDTVREEKGWLGLPPAEGALEDLTDADPGSRPWELGAVIAVAILVPLVILFQQFTRGLHETGLQNIPAHVAEDETIYPPGCDPLTIQSKCFVKLTALFER
jgi:hypothetical protein